ncbi:glutaredoxin-C4 [Phialemonium atrogriseum]|uniref:Glutaredoxin-C4 n=1 Tax=Phialemonium atrogriseum TaxID=1093897 RepID=A0AAJ0BUQ4_9PEZI|nr:glutaredoxin-C4 [Phialemonium atrogriseum]KAK1764665.1 glutaredoxin-C4 [Phialemonium atrogriseum]
MPSPRRIRLLFYVVLAGVVTMLFFTAQQRQSRPADTRTLRDFYGKTMGAMDKARGASGGGGGGGGGQAVMDKATGDVDGDGDIDEDDERLARETSERLRAAEQKAKELANAKGPNRPDPPRDVIGVGSSAEGQVKKVGAGADGAGEEVVESEEEHEVEVVLNGILKKAPVIIFSKSYCPHSKRAKGILLEKYVIDPPPFVVELDTHPLGRQIQDRLGETTGRSTVPNVMVSGKSIGGGDEIAALDSQKALAETIRTYGGKAVGVTERFAGNGRVI